MMRAAAYAALPGVESSIVGDGFAQGDFGAPAVALTNCAAPGAGGNRRRHEWPDRMLRLLQGDVGSGDKRSLP